MVSPIHMRTINETRLWLTWDSGRVTDEEVLGLILGNTEVATELLYRIGDITRLPQITVQELLQVPGIGEVAAHRLRAAIELNGRIARHSVCRPQITSPADVATLLLAEMSALDHEQLRVVLLNTKSYVLKIETLYQGTINCANVRIAEVFKTAIRMNAAHIIICHNHPSGQPEPSPQDVSLTRQLVEAGRMLDIPLVDHLIIGGGCWVSLRERHLGF